MKVQQNNIGTTKITTKSVENRRTFIRKTFSLGSEIGLATIALLGFSSLKKSKTAPKGSRYALGIVRPPGALEEKDFLSLCIRCTRCSDSCEAQCILLFGPEAGRLQGTPYIEPQTRGCTMCLKCGETCPTEALLVLTKKEEIKMGLAVVDERLCVSHNGTGVCGACHTVCQLRNKAITQDIRNRPTIHEEHCTGCGMCEELCIVLERRAIQVKTDRLWPGFVKSDIT